MRAPGLAAGMVLTICMGLGCSTSAPATVARTRDAQAPDAGVRVKKRTVAIELPPIGWQSFGPGADGGFEYGQIEPIDGAVTCVTMRREAFATFQPFSPLESPICVTTGAGEVVRLGGIPADSDLVLTVTLEGFVPASLTSRVEDFDVLLPNWLGEFFTTLWARDDWVDTPKPLGDLSRTMATIAMVWGGPTGARVSGGVLPARSAIKPGLAMAAEADLTIDRHGDAQGVPIEISPPADRPAFLDLPEGLYRVHVSHPRAECDAFGTPMNFLLAGLPAGGPGEIELPVWAGHSAAVVAECWCFPMNLDRRVLDLASCTFDAGDGGL